MNQMNLTEIEIAPPTVVRAAGRDFAAALAETPQFIAFEQAYESLRHDTAAQQALSAYQTKMESLRALLMLNAVGDDERAELEQLTQDYLTRLCAGLHRRRSRTNRPLPKGRRDDLGSHWPQLRRCLRRILLWVMPCKKR